MMKQSAEKTTSKNAVKTVIPHMAYRWWQVFADHACDMAGCVGYFAGVDAIFAA